MVSLDLKDAYSQVPMHPASRKFLRFVMCGKVTSSRFFALGSPRLRRFSPGFFALGSPRLRRFSPESWLLFRLFFTIPASDFVVI